MAMVSTLGFRNGLFSPSGHFLTPCPSSSVLQVPALIKRIVTPTRVSDRLKALEDLHDVATIGMKLSDTLPTSTAPSFLGFSVSNALFSCSTCG